MRRMPKPRTLRKELRGPYKRIVHPENARTEHEKRLTRDHVVNVNVRGIRPRSPVLDGQR